MHEDTKIFKIKNLTENKIDNLQANSASDMLEAFANNDSFVDNKQNKNEINKIDLEPKGKEGKFFF